MQFFSCHICGKPKNKPGHNYCSYPHPECKHEEYYTEFRDQFPRLGDVFNPKANGVWNVCKDCKYEWQDGYLTAVEQWGRRKLGLDDN